MAVLLFILAARAELFDPLLRVVDEVIFNKPLTDSMKDPGGIPLPGRL